jgi:dienelactone hydrolase
MKNLLRGALLMTACGGAIHAQQQPDLSHLALRTELHQVPTLTVSDQQFLAGDDVGATRVTVVGQLELAQHPGRLPVVIMLHGSGGIDARAEIWSSQFHAMGISTFILDSLTGRGLSSVSADQGSLGRLNLIIDAYRALEVLAKNPRVDSSKIVLMGFSRGGQATLYASVTRFNQLWNKSGLTFAAYLPFYPDCGTTYLMDARVAVQPIRIFQGTSDDYNPIAPCRSYVLKLRDAGADVQLTEYPNAHHVFDNPLLAETDVARDAQTVRRCTITEETVGELINTATQQPFSYRDTCVERGPHIGYDPAASASAHQAVSDFLAARLKLP